MTRPARQYCAYLTVDEAAAHLRVSTKTIRRLITRGELPALRVGRAVRFRQADIEAWADAQVGATSRPQVSTRANKMRTGSRHEGSKWGSWCPPDTPSEQDVRGRRVS